MTYKETMKKQVETICKGCGANTPSPCSYLPIVYKGTSKEFICPCSTCLIKMICVEERDCEMLQEYYIVMAPIRDGIYRWDIQNG